MSDAKDTKKKKTLSLKLGAKPSISQSNSFEAGKTVVVAKKRVRKSINSDKQVSASHETTSDSNVKNIEDELQVSTQESKKSRTVLKPLSKDQQKALLKAKTEKEQNDAINKIRGTEKGVQEKKVEEVNKNFAANWKDYKCVVFGHVGDGNLHIIGGVGSDDKKATKLMETCIYDPLKSIKGAISAEHGIGLEKKDYLEISRSEIEINLMRTLKKALDPNSILNPGKVFD